jgi:hypothetical protein
MPTLPDPDHQSCILIITYGALLLIARSPSLSFQLRAAPSANSATHPTHEHLDTTAATGERINGVVVTWVVAIRLTCRPAGGSIPS